MNSRVRNRDNFITCHNKSRQAIGRKPQSNNTLNKA
jgi:hypothetical protein